MSLGCACQLRSDFDSKKKSHSGRSILQYSTIGIQLAATVTLFVVGGYKLDEHWNLSPVCITIGSFLGMAIGFYQLIKQLQQIERINKERAAKERKTWLR